MFGLGFKKNEEKDILIRTITELQELRAELSVLKDRLFLIMPDQAGENLDAKAAEAEGMAEGSGDTDLSSGQPEFQEDIIMEAAPHEVTGMAPPEEQPEALDPEIVNAELCAPGGDASEESPMLTVDQSGVDPAGGEIPEPVNTGVKKEWAVVSLVEAKRPWWRLWGSRDHLVRRSI